MPSNLARTRNKEFNIAVLVSPVKGDVELAFHENN